MKKKIFFLTYILLLLSITMYSQRKYRYTDNLGTFIGTWEYKAEGLQFTLELRLGQLDLSDTYGGCILGDYKLVKNGQLVGDYTQTIPTHITDNTFSIPYCSGFFGDNGCSRPDCVTPNELYVHFWDRGYGENYLVGSFTLLTSTTARFEIWETGGTTADSTVRTISVPQDVVMTKVPPPHTMPDNPDPPQPDL